MYHIFSIFDHSPGSTDAAPQAAAAVTEAPQPLPSIAPVTPPTEPAQATLPEPAPEEPPEVTSGKRSSTEASTEEASQSPGPDFGIETPVAPVASDEAQAKFMEDIARQDGMTTEKAVVVDSDEESLRASKCIYIYIYI